MRIPQYKELDDRCRSLRIWLSGLNVRRVRVRTSVKGFTLLELIATLSVLTVLVIGTVPLMQNAVKRQKEIRLRQNLREIREAIDAFKRDSIGACPEGAIRTGNPAGGSGGSNNIPADPRSRVVIDDCEIFDVENLDKLPPSLEILVDGVKVKSRGLPPQAAGGGVFTDKNATELAEVPEITKKYLRAIPRDPMSDSEEADWEIRSSYQAGDASSWDEVNVFDVHSSSDGTALNGEKYSDW